VEIAYRDRTLVAPVHIVPGQPDDCVTLHLGYGRARAGVVGTGRGFNAYALRTTDSPWVGTQAQVKRIDRVAELPLSQIAQLMYGRDLVRVLEIEPFRRGAQPENPGDVTQHEHSAAPGVAPGAAHGNGHGAPAEGKKHYPLTLFDESHRMKQGNAWAMVIDLNACIGCNACVVACQAENNIPVVGPSEVAKGRIMHWLRIDTYFASDHPERDHEFVFQDKLAENPDVYFQPVPCMHCENAPCELVCPTGATVHDVEGTNNMVYNRCIGTRYCSNNCPYKVRRFNWVEYNNVSQSEALGKNPDVTIRSRGVMEKCTYCIQRINQARIESKLNNVPGGFAEEGKVLTACQQTCPTEAIIFGNLLDPRARVTALASEPQRYSLLDELNAKPRTTYLPRVKNSTPEQNASCPTHRPSSAIASHASIR
jgi:molybdopterin-containing oxidoreductase family iron-sulfur binding subunit